MSGFHLVIANKAYSSWSLRPWLLLKELGLPFQETVIPLDRPDTRETILRHSPTGKVPLLRHDGVVVWDSLAIAEYLAEQFPDRGLWPAERAVRAVARSVVAEMHSSFANLRKEMPMNVRASKPGRTFSADAQADIDRVIALWEGCRKDFGRAGDGLFGAYSIADAFYAPVATRFLTYGVALPPAAASYVDWLRHRPAMQDWYRDAAAEPWRIEKYEAI